MSDKENVEKENEQFSSSILYVATAIYVGVCAMVFGALYAKLPTFGEAFLILMKDYGTILAGIPVLVAVIVAKQQLDANRRQHVATIKRSLKSEIDSLDILSRFASDIVKRTYADYAIVSHLVGAEGILISRPLGSELSAIKSTLPSLLHARCMIVVELVEQVKQASIGSKFPCPKIEALLQKMRVEGSNLLVSVDEERQRLSQYWS